MRPRMPERAPGLLHRLLVADTDDASIQFLRYLFVGGLAFVVDFGALWAFTSVLGVHYLVSTALAFVLGLSTNYALSVTWIFKQHRLASRKGEFLAFALIGLAGLAFNEVGMWLLTGGMGLDYRLAKLLTTGFVFLWNFVARRYLLFGATKTPGTEAP